jgi:iron complex transport system permease protein
MILVGIFVGPAGATFEDTLNGLLFSGDGLMDTIVWSIRIPRIVVSMLVGGCLGLAGVLIQLSTRSSLGDPNLFGIGGGAAIFLASVAAGILSFAQIGVFAGAIISSVIIALFLTRLVSTADLTPVKLAIMGIAVGALTIAIGTSVISHGRVFPTQVIGLVAGSFTASNWSVVYYLVPTLTVCLGIAIIFSSRFYPIMLGDILARSLGVNPLRTRTIAMGLVGVLSGASVYAGGLIGFVGLTSPHIARKLLGNTPVHLVVGSTLIGALTTIFADQVARLLFAPIELPVGMATTVIGAPMMMYLALKMK